MKHRVLALIIALFTGAIITLLLIPAGLTNKQLWIVFLITITITFLVTWIFNEFIIFRDLLKLKLQVRKYTTGNELEKIGLKMGETSEVSNEIINILNHQNIEFEDLIKKSDLRKQFIADISHELKSPLFSAQGYVHTLLDSEVDDQDLRRKFLKRAARNLDYIDNLIQDLLVLSQIESKSVQMIRDHFDLKGLINEIVEEYQSRAKKRGIKLEIESEKDAVIVFADYTRMVMVLTNLIGNAIKYGDPKKEQQKVKISAQVSNNKLNIVIKDNGIGIDHHHLDKIYDMFYRASEDSQGSGLGLYIVKETVNLLGGTINIDSTKYKGTKVSVSIPEKRQA
jgi:two-component system phosphate regulon sensor histidine kinase PhoR